jgi:uracil-DNA glycosylase family 4
MEGFFTTKETESISRPDGKTYSCFSCGLYKGVQTPKMKPYGDFKKKILIIGEAPGRLEDLAGIPFQGNSGRYLRSFLKKQGIDWKKDCLSIYAAKCRPVCDKGRDRLPSNYEIESCRKLALKVIQERKPELIIILGVLGLYSLIQHRFKKDFGNINKWRGWVIPDQDLKAYLCPIFDIQRVLDRNNKEKYETEVIWEQDIERALNALKTPFPVFKEPKIKYVTDLSFLNKLKPQTYTAFDYETTGLKPHAKGHKIICCAVAVSPDKVYSFMLPKGKKLKPFLKYLKNPHLPKIAQNMKYEDTWSEVLLDTTVQGWDWDTMQATHILDNRSSITSLKFQSYVQFGIIDYDSEINPYLIAKDANSINNIEKLIKQPGGERKLLKYCAWDSILEFRLAVIQKKLFENLLPF